MTSQVLGWQQSLSSVDSDVAQQPGLGENAINWVPVTYCAAKGAIRGLTTSLARDVAPEIRVNALAPGPISGNWKQEWGVAPEHIEEAKAMNPMKRFGDPREIAETVLFLADLREWPAGAALGRCSSRATPRRKRGAC